MGFVYPDSIEEIKEFLVKISADIETARKFKLCFDFKPSEEALIMADDSAEAVSEKAVGREELRRVFSTFDKNGDGLISKQEMRESFDKLRLCVGEEELVSTIQTVDVNGEGIPISTTEF